MGVVVRVVLCVRVVMARCSYLRVSLPCLFVFRCVWRFESTLLLSDVLMYTRVFACFRLCFKFYFSYRGSRRALVWVVCVSLFFDYAGIAHGWEGF